MHVSVYKQSMSETNQLIPSNLKYRSADLRGQMNGAKTELLS